MKYLSLYFLLISAQSVTGQTTENGLKEAKGLSASVKKNVLEKAKQLIRENYVLKDQVEHINNELDKGFINGDYDTTTINFTFAWTVTYNLKKYSNDKHFRVYTQFARGNNSNSKLKYDSLQGIKEVKYLKDSVGYIKFNYFPQLNDSSKKVYGQALQSLAGSKTLIIDLRDNFGGNPYFEAYLCSYFFRDSTHLYDVYSRRDDSLFQFWTHKKIIGNRFEKIPIYILVGDNTFSAGEAFAYDLQAQRRATIIGEQTPGGANPGTSFEIDENFKIFIPVSKPINCITKSNWEGVGVVPDIKMKFKSVEEVIKKIKKSKK